MNPKSIAILQKIFWIIGWSVLAVSVAATAMEAYAYFVLVPDSLIPVSKKTFSFLGSTRRVFSEVGLAFSAFLVSDTFELIFHRVSRRPQRTERFLVLACIGFIGEGMLGVITWTLSASQIVPAYDLSTVPGVFSVSMYVVSIFSSLISFLIALTIYVFYRQFQRMVSVEVQAVGS